MKKIDTDLWVWESYFTSIGCKGSTRMTIIRNKNELFIHSPIALKDTDYEFLKSLGNVKHVVAPNLMHHMYLRDFHAQFPDAQYWLPEGLEKKIGDFPSHKILDDNDPVLSTDFLLQCRFDGHKINETVFFHIPTSTLITADLLYNYRAEQYTAEKIFFWLIGSYGKPTVPFYHKYALKEKNAVTRFLGKVARWPAKRIIMSHGNIIENESAPEILRSAWMKFDK